MQYIIITLHCRIISIIIIVFCQSWWYSRPSVIVLVHLFLSLVLSPYLFLFLCLDQGALQQNKITP